MSATTPAHLRAAIDGLRLIKARDPRAWPIAEVLAERDVAQCTAALAEQLAAARVPDVPPDVEALLTTEEGLAELFGAPSPRMKSNQLIDDTEGRTARSHAALQNDTGHAYAGIRPRLRRDRFARCQTVEARL